MSEAKTEDWTKALRCVLPGRTECAAKVETACLCRQLPREAYLRYLRERNGEGPKRA